MPNLSALTNSTTQALALGRLVLATPETPSSYQPINKARAGREISSAQQPPKLLFHYEGEQSVLIQSDITDHYIEDNTAIQDQIALRPEEVNTQGYIGELNDIVPTLPFDISPKFIADKLTAISTFGPSLTTTQANAYNRAAQTYQVAEKTANAAVSAWSSLKNLVGAGSDEAGVISSTGLGGFDIATGKVSGVQNKQQTTFQQFYGYWRAKTLFSVQTPWALFQNMAIKTLRPVQDAETREISSFEVTFKMIRKANTIVEGSGGIDSSFNQSSRSYQQRANAQSAPLNNIGTSTPPESSQSFAGSISTVVG